MATRSLVTADSTAGWTGAIRRGKGPKCGAYMGWAGRAGGGGGGGVGGGDGVVVTAGLVCIVRGGHEQESRWLIYAFQCRSRRVGIPPPKKMQ